MACILPIRIKAKTTADKITYGGGYRLVPCGKCTKCRLKRVNDWVLRLTEENKKRGDGLFVTLTYSPEFVNEHPYEEYINGKPFQWGRKLKSIVSTDYRITPNGLMTCSKRDVQTFIKRLRKNSCRDEIKYFCASEYGDKFERPHYHLIMFGCSKEDIEFAWYQHGMPIGNITVYPLKPAAIAYTCKYINKDKKVPKHSRDDRVPEFFLMSKNLGANYLSSDVVKYHRNTNINYYVKDGGFTASLPRYYKERIWSPLERMLLSDQSQELHKKLHERKLHELDGDITEYYRMQGELKRQDNYKRKIINNKKDKL
jgi:hypothetical protein